MESTGKVLTQESEEFQNLSYIWQCLPKRVAKSRRFVNLVTSAFPPLKAQSLLLKELEWNRYFDCFQYNAQARKWSCLSCAYPEKTK
jgi:hypothetical protein